MADVGVVKYKVELDDSDVGKQADKTESTLMSKFGGAAKKVGAAALAASTAVVTSTAAAVTSLTKQAVAAYADYEQLVGGVETLFGDAADYVQNRSAAAFETAGLSANEYMETVTSFSASLIQSLGGDTQKAAELADQAIIDMADNANKMGSSMESIQNAYQGFAKQNYTMLDNLKLGYGGTKEEMARLLADAEKLSGVKYDLSSYADIVEAIHVVQENMGIAGTTAEEAASTISGSLAMVKASWQNVVTAIGEGNDEVLSEYIYDLTDSLSTAAGNLLPTIEAALNGIATAVEVIVPEIAEMLPEMITSALPSLLNAGTSAIEALAQGFLDAVPSMLPTIMDVIKRLGEMIIKMAPEIVKCGVSLIGELANGLAQALPELIPAAVEAIMEIVEALTDPSNISMLVDAAISLIMGLAEGLIEAIPVLIEHIPQIIENIVTALIDNLPKLVEGAIQLVVMLVTHLPEIIMGLIKAIPEIIKAILGAFGPIVEGLGNLFSEAWEGIKGVFSSVGGWFKDKFTDAKEKASEAWAGVKENMARNWEQSKEIFSNIGSWFSEKFSDARDKASEAWSKVKENMANNWEQSKEIFANIGGWFKDKFTEAKENSVSAWSNIKDKMSAIWDKIKSAFKFGDALQWGKDMIQNFVDGIKAMFGKVKDAVGNVAQTVRNFLHFSEPDEGPLADFSTYAPDMMKLFAQGMKDNINVVKTETFDVAKTISESFTADLNLPDISGYAADLSAMITATNSTEIIVPLNVDGREIARASAWYMNEQLAWEAR